ncbi:methyl-accepting chemotaxis protein [uncultured Dechloromonas sp.]|uniref:methyl-accepting chemotaxis protein n=1 Tax=uncultured Dechloromonas sp. TaxID=171719 RepID=UPI0025DC9983|nr:methyl-accepting chemotaxis protein [uncultured Dechloromonas sp.]
MRNTSIKARLAIGYAILLLLIVIVGAAGIRELGTINGKLNEITSINDVEKDMALRLRINVDVQAITIRDIVLALNAEERNKASEHLNQLRGQFAERHEKLMKMFQAYEGQPNELEQMSKMKAESDAVKPFFDSIRELALAGKTAEAMAKAPEIASRLKGLREATEALAKIEDEMNVSAIKEAQASYERAKTTLISVMLVAVLLTVAGAWLLTRSITLPMASLESTLNKVATGDVSLQVTQSGRDELTRMESSTAQMVKSLSDAIGQVRSNADNVAENAGLLSGAAKQVRESSEAQSEASSAMAAALEEMSASINHVANLSQDARQMAQNASTGADSGARQVAAMLDEIGRVAKTIEESAESSRALDQESEKISTIVNVIKDVADQTNLLALNAAIEAARAGETGRGFAVVADEVRKLAERTTTSAQEITSMVSGIQERARRMSGSMAHTVDQMREGMQMAEQAGAVMGTINDGAKQVTAVIDDVAIALKEQASASHDLANRVELIVQMVDENSSAVSSVAGSAGQLDHLAGDLLNAVSRFKTA